MFLHSLFSPEFIIVDMEAEDKDEAFEELVSCYCRVNHAQGREEILKALREREAKMSTGIQKGIAIPHGRTNAVDSIKGVLGISRKGIDYDSLDGEPVYLLFMIITPHDNSEAELLVLKRLAELLDNPAFIIDLQAQKDAVYANKVISKYEEILKAVD